MISGLSLCRTIRLSGGPEDLLTTREPSRDDPHDAPADLTSQNTTRPLTSCKLRPFPCPRSRKRSGATTLFEWVGCCNCRDSPASFTRDPSAEAGKGSKVHVVSVAGTDVMER
jgi:hypothetical protein